MNNMLIVNDSLTKARSDLDEAAHALSNYLETKNDEESVAWLHSAIEATVRAVDSVSLAVESLAVERLANSASVRRDELMNSTAELVAGRELDALVAEKVMGWTWLALPDLNAEQHALVPPGFRDASPARWVGHNLFELVPVYSTDIAAAWQVLDEMVFRVGTANVRLDMEDYGRGSMNDQGAERAVWVTIGDVTAFGPIEFAICRAALAAIAS